MPSSNFIKLITPQTAFWVHEHMQKAAASYANSSKPSWLDTVKASFELLAAAFGSAANIILCPMDGIGKALSQCSRGAFKKAVYAITDTTRDALKSLVASVILAVGSIAGLFAGNRIFRHFNITTDDLNSITSTNTSISKTSDKKESPEPQSSPMQSGVSADNTQNSIHDDALADAQETIKNLKTQIADLQSRLNTQEVPQAPATTIPKSLPAPTTPPPPPSATAPPPPSATAPVFKTKNPLANLMNSKTKKNDAEATQKETSADAPPQQPRTLKEELEAAFKKNKEKKKNVEISPKNPSDTPVATRTGLRSTPKANPQPPKEVQQEPAFLGVKLKSVANKPKDMPSNTSSESNPTVKTPNATENKTSSINE
jgi:hypothetical protein